MLIKRPPADASFKMLDVEAERKLLSDVLSERRITVRERVMKMERHFREIAEIQKANNISQDHVGVYHVQTVVLSDMMTMAIHGPREPFNDPPCQHPVAVLDPDWVDVLKDHYDSFKEEGSSSLDHSEGQGNVEVPPDEVTSGDDPATAFEGASPATTARMRKHRRKPMLQTVATRLRKSLHGDAVGKRDKKKAKRGGSKGHKKTKKTITKVKKVKKVVKIKRKKKRSEYKALMKLTPEERFQLMQAQDREMMLMMGGSADSSTCNANNASPDPDRVCDDEDFWRRKKEYKRELKLRQQQEREREKLDKADRGAWHGGIKRKGSKAKVVKSVLSMEDVFGHRSMKAGGVAGEGSFEVDMEDIQRLRREEDTNSRQLERQDGHRSLAACELELNHDEEREDQEPQQLAVCGKKIEEQIVDNAGEHDTKLAGAPSSEEMRGEDLTHAHLGNSEPAVAASAGRSSSRAGGIVDDVSDIKETATITEKTVGRKASLSRISDGSGRHNLDQYSIYFSGASSHSRSSGSFARMSHRASSKTHRPKSCDGRGLNANLLRLKLLEASASSFRTSGKDRSETAGDLRGDGSFNSRGSLDSEFTIVEEQGEGDYYDEEIEIEVEEEVEVEVEDEDEVEEGEEDGDEEDHENEEDQEKEEEEENHHAAANACAKTEAPCTSDRPRVAKRRSLRPVPPALPKEKLTSLRRNSLKVSSALSSGQTQVTATLDL